MLSDRCLSVLSVCDVGVLWPNGWMDQDETWHGGRLRPCHIVLDGSKLPRKGAQQPPYFRPMPIVAKRSPISVTTELLLVFILCSTVFRFIDRVTYLGRKPRRTQQSLAVDANIALHAGAKSVILDWLVLGLIYSL